MTGSLAVGERGGGGVDSAPDHSSGSDLAALGSGGSLPTVAWREFWSLITYSFWLPYPGIDGQPLALEQKGTSVLQ